MDHPRVNEMLYKNRVLTTPGNEWYLHRSSPFQLGDDKRIGWGCFGTPIIASARDMQRVMNYRLTASTHARRE